MPGKINPRVFSQLALALPRTPDVLDYRINKAYRERRDDVGPAEATLPVAIERLLSGEADPFAAHLELALKCALGGSEYHWEQLFRRCHAVESPLATSSEGTGVGWYIPMAVQSWLIGLLDEPGAPHFCNAFALLAALIVVLSRQREDAVVPFPVVGLTSRLENGLIPGEILSLQPLEALAVQVAYGEAVEDPLARVADCVEAASQLMRESREAEDEPAAEEIKSSSEKDRPESRARGRPPKRVGQKEKLVRAVKMAGALGAGDAALKAGILGKNVYKVAGRAKKTYGDHFKLADDADGDRRYEYRCPDDPGTCQTCLMFDAESDAWD